MTAPSRGQPRGLLRIASANPLARGIRGGYLGSSSSFFGDPAAPGVVGPSASCSDQVFGTGTRRSDAYGGKLSLVAVSSPLPGNSSFTLMAIARPTTQVNASTFTVANFGQNNNSNSASINVVGNGSSAVYGGSIYLSGIKTFGGTLSVNTSAVEVVGIRQIYNTEQAVFVNGVKDPVTAAFTGSGFATSSFGSNGFGANTEIYLIVYWDRALSDAEISAFSANPYQIFQAPDEDDFVLAGSGKTGASATTDGADTSASSGSVLVSGTSAATDSADTSSASGTVSSTSVTGSSATTDGADVSTASGGVAISGSAASTDGSDSTAATGGVSISGTSVANDGADVSVGVGAVAISGTSATVDAADISSAIGTVTTGVTGSSSTTDGADVSAASGGVAVSGSSAVTDGADVSTALGAVAVSGSSATTDGQDISIANGSVATGISGSANTVDGADVVSAFGTVAIIGSAAANDGADISSASGSVGVSVVSSALMPNPHQTYIGNTRIRTYLAQTRVRSL